MTEPAFREIQLSRKQLVFLFMSTAAVAVVIFLLGVSVGQGLGAGTAVDAGVPGDTLVATGATSTEPVPGELTYPEELLGPPAGGSQAPLAGQPATSPDTTSSPPTTSPAVELAPKPVAPPPPEPDPIAPPATPTAGTPAPSGGWMIQVGAFGSRENADRMVATLKQRGHAAFMTQVTSNTVPFVVRVGPFPDRADAARAVPQVSKDSGVSAPLIIR